MENKGWDINKLMSTLHKARWTHKAKQKNEGQLRLLALFQTNVKGRGRFLLFRCWAIPLSIPPSVSVTTKSLMARRKTPGCKWADEGESGHKCVSACIWCVCVRAPVCFVCDRCAEHQWFIVIRLPRPVCQTEARECCLLCTSMCLIRPQVMVTFAFSWESVLQKRTWCHRSSGGNKILSPAIQNCKHEVKKVQLL